MSTNQTPFTPKFGLEVPLPSKFHADVVVKDKLSLAISTPLAVGTTINLTTASGNIVPITGTGIINSFGSTDNPGESFELVFDNVVVITSGAELIIPGGNLAIGSGDRVNIVSETSTRWKITGGNRADGTPLFDNSIVYAIALG